MSVSKQWYQALEDPKIWEEFYCVTWRDGKKLPDRLKCQMPLDHIKSMCKQRATLQVSLSCRAKNWTRSNGNIFVHNDSLDSRAFVSGGIESIRTENSLTPMFLGQLNQGIVYFEAKIRGCGSVGFASISSYTERISYGFGSDLHVGWESVSYGYHGDDGSFYWNDDQGRQGGNCIPFGPTWGEPRVGRRHLCDIAIVGCGYGIFNQRNQMFYTLNGHFLGFVPMEILPNRLYAGAVTLHQLGDSVEFNFGRNGFEFDLETFHRTQLMTSTLEHFLERTHINVIHTITTTSA
jgi:hypothetical protein